MLIVALLGGLALGMVFVRYNPHAVAREWAPLYALLRFLFGFGVVLGAYYHTGPRAIALTVAMFATLALLVAVYWLGHGKPKE